MRLSPNLAAIRAAAADGHSFIQLQAKVEEVTTVFCRRLDGLVVTMRRAIAQLDRILGWWPQGTWSP